MRLLLALLCVVASFSLPTAAVAQVTESGCRLFPDGSTRDTLYVTSAEVLKAVSCPALVRTASTDYGFFSHTAEEAKASGVDMGSHPSFKGKSTFSLFQATVAESDKYVLLRVQRVIHPDFNRTAVYWFDYIERGFVKGLR